MVLPAKMVPRKFSGLALGLLVACQGASTNGSRESVSTTRALYAGIAWIRDGTLVVAAQRSSSALPARAQLWIVEPVRGKLRPLAMSQDDLACPKPDFQIPVSLSDGRLGFVQRCSRPGADDFVISAYDPRTRWVERLVTPPLRFLPLQWSWASGRATGAVARSNGICASIALVTQAGEEPLPALIPQGEQTFRVDAGFVDETRDCTMRGRADWPAWNPPASALAFFASPRSIGVAGRARLEVPWNLYVLDLEGLRVVEKLSNIGNPMGLAWSPDGHWLAFSGDVRGKGQGAWLYAVSNGRLERVSTKLLGSISWSPDSQRLAAVHLTDTTGVEIESEIVIIDIHDLGTAGS